MAFFLILLPNLKDFRFMTKVVWSDLHILVLSMTPKYGLTGSVLHSRDFLFGYLII